MKVLGRHCWALLTVLLLQGYAIAGEIIDLVYQKKGFEGSKERQYSVFLPTDYDGGEPLPLVVVLHGCEQTHRDIMNDTRFNDLAESEKFIALYPFITSYDGMRSTNCWGYWIEDEIHQGKGEVGDIAGIIREVQEGFPVDPRRIHITGLSSGGGMTTAMMVVYSEIIASGAPAAGTAYGETPCAVRNVCLTYNIFDPSTWLDWWGPRFESTGETVSEMATEMGGDKRLVPLLVLHSTNDSMVEDAAAWNNAVAWGKLFEVDMTTPVVDETGETEGRTWHHSQYGSYGTGSAIETHFVDGPGHGWVGGAQGTYADPDGPDWAVIAWGFFKSHPLVEQ